MRVRTVGSTMIASGVAAIAFGYCFALTLYDPGFSIRTLPAGGITAAYGKHVVHFDASGTPIAEQDAELDDRAVVPCPATIDLDCRYVRALALAANGELAVLYSNSVLIFGPDQRHQRTLHFEPSSHPDALGYLGPDLLVGYRETGGIERFQSDGASLGTFGDARSQEELARGAEEHRRAWHVFVRVLYALIAAAIIVVAGEVIVLLTVPAIDPRFADRLTPQRSAYDRKRARKKTLIVYGALSTVSLLALAVLAVSSAPYAVAIAVCLMPALIIGSVVHQQPGQLRRSGERFLSHHAKAIISVLEPEERVVLSVRATSRRSIFALRARGMHILVTDRPRLLLFKPGVWPVLKPKLLRSIRLADLEAIERELAGGWKRAFQPLARVRIRASDAATPIELALPGEDESLALAETMREGAGRLSIARDPGGALSKL